MALRKAWQKMKTTLSSDTRQFLVTRELWEIFLAEDQKNCAVQGTKIFLRFDKSHSDYA